jgi:hypothetical protein
LLSNEALAVASTVKMAEISPLVLRKTYELVRSRGSESVVKMVMPNDEETLMLAVALALILLILAERVARGFI